MLLTCNSNVSALLISQISDAKTKTKTLSFNTKTEALKIGSRDEESPFEHYKPEIAPAVEPIYLFVDFSFKSRLQSFRLRQSYK